MTLSIQRSDRRDRRLCRFGVMLVVCSLVINMVAVPKAKAVVIDATAAFGAAAATAAINGTTATTLFSGMGTAAATNGIIIYMDAYAAATGVAASGAALASTIATGILVAGGTLLVGAAAAALIGGFIDWMREQEGLEPGGDPVTFGVETGLFSYGGVILPSFPDFSAYVDWNNYLLLYHSGTGIPHIYCLPDSVYLLESGSLTNTFRGTRVYARLIDGVWEFISSTKSAGAAWVTDFDDYRWSSFDIPFQDGTVKYSGSAPEPVYEEGTEVALQPKPEFQPIPNEIPEGQVFRIDTGLASLPSEDPQAIADAIMQSAIDGTLAPTVSVQADPSVQPDPEPEPDSGTDPELPPDAPELPSNLGDLGYALTTRFPFSIPWDIAKAVKLLAAPAKPPYWEIDFMEPIRYRFEDLGDTTIKIDFGKPEYEIIGITTRLTSTIGFCLALAAATKRFIWTA